MKIYRIANASVADPVIMYGIREIGKNVPIMKFTYWVEEASNWRRLSDPLKNEIIKAIITPYRP